MILAFFSSLLVIAGLILRHLLSGSGLRFLVDSYGLDSQKLKKLKPSDLKALRKQINLLRKQNDAFGLEELTRKYRP